MVYLSFWTKEREAGVWDLKGKLGNSQVEKKSKHMMNKFLLGHPETKGHRESNKQPLLDFSLATILSSYMPA